MVCWGIRISDYVFVRYFSVYFVDFYSVVLEYVPTLVMLALLNKFAFRQNFCLRGY